MGFWRTLLTRGDFAASPSAHPVCGKQGYWHFRRLERKGREGEDLRTLPHRYSAWAALRFVPIILLLADCAAPATYMGIDLAAAPQDAQQAAVLDLARRAQARDKQAQLELGIRYEEGRGVPVDRMRAKEFYKLAASDSGGSLWIYSPPVGNKTRGRVIAVDAGPRQIGLPEAKKRLQRLETLGGL